MIRRNTEALARSAFTLMEMLVVVAILVVLAGAAVPIYLNYLENARRDRVKIDVKNLETAVEAYYTRNSDFPQSLDMLCQPDETGKAALEPESLLDPWGQHYVYNPSDMKPSGRVPYIYSQRIGKQLR
jgi:general secretion pathway protein G